MPSRNAELDGEWFEFEFNDAGLLPAGRPQKLRLYADHNFPYAIVQELRGAKLPVTTAAEDARASHDDGAIYQRARKLDRVLLTLDGDFWDDRRHRLLDGPGVIVVAIPGSEVRAIVHALAQFYALFARYFSREWWPEGASDPRWPPNQSTYADGGRRIRDPPRQDPRDGA